MLLLSSDGQNYFPERARWKNEIRHWNKQCGHLHREEEQAKVGLNHLQLNNHFDIIIAVVFHVYEDFDDTREVLILLRFVKFLYLISRDGINWVLILLYVSHSAMKWKRFPNFFSHAIYKSCFMRHFTAISACCRSVISSCQLWSNRSQFAADTVLMQILFWCAVLCLSTANHTWSSPAPQRLVLLATMRWARQKLTFSFLKDISVGWTESAPHRLCLPLKKKV